MSLIKLYKGFLFFFAIFVLMDHTVAQKIISGTVKDSHSEELVPFASVYFKNTSIGKLTDSAGFFSFHLGQWPGDTLIITSVGYQPFFYAIDKTKDSILLNIQFERGTFNEGVKVKTKVNKGLLLWRKIVQNKSRNDRYRFANFSYELYNKLELDIKNINVGKITKFKPLRPVGELLAQNLDSSEGVTYLPSYLTETISDYYYQKKPLKRREIIRAANINGVKNESIIKFLGGMDQNVNIYNNFIPVFNREFVSPASDNGDLYYNYRVTDTQQVSGSRFYHLVFVPRRKGTNTFEGDCWVHAGSFAIQRMNLRLGKDANINFVETLSLIQEYKLLDDSTWFLAKDKFVADVSPVGKSTPGFIGRKTTTYKNIFVNDTSVVNELNKNKLVEEIITLPGAAEKDKQFWSDTRHEELTKTEAGIIKMLDTLTIDPNFQRVTRQIVFLTTGYLNVGNVQMGPWFYWVTANSWEGLRLRFDLGSNKKFDKKWWWHWYLAYGFNDKKIKGKAELFYLPKKHPRRYWYASYINDLDHGQNYYGVLSADNLFALAIRKQNVPIKFIKLEEARFEFFNEHRSGLSELPSVAYKRYTPLQNLPPKDSFPVKDGGEPLSSFEISFRLRFAYLERFMESQFFRLSLGSPYPIGEITITQGIPGVLRSSYSYTKISGNISDYMKVPPLGTISYMVFAGQTFGTVPYVFLNIAPGNELYYYNKNAFNMMNRYEFIQDKYVGINFEHNVGNGLFRFIPKLKFRQFWTVKTLWGGLSKANKELNFHEGTTFQSLDGQTYMEIGTGVDNILRFLRVDFIWRVLPTSDINPSTKKFGVFGSMRLNF